jgi:hypothetical protein
MECELPQPSVYMYHTATILYRDIHMSTHVKIDLPIKCIYWILLDLGHKMDPLAFVSRTFSNLYFVLSLLEVTETLRN